MVFKSIHTDDHTFSIGQLYYQAIFQNFSSIFASRSSSLVMIAQDENSEHVVYNGVMEAA